MGTDATYFRFAVIADSHFRVEGTPDVQLAYPSDALHNKRNRRAVALVQRANPAIVIHLGDVVHPVPGLTAHRHALDVASSTYAPLGDIPLHVVPGNHDVGDKPRGWSNAPGIGTAAHEVFREYWGPAWRSFDHHGLHFVLVDTPILGSGLAMEQEQWDWLDGDLAAAKASGQRIFAFVHYPPYLLHPDEPEHYDNLALPQRRRLLALLHDAGVEALFCGHVHNFFWDRTRGMDTYVLPSTSFVRPEYAELASVPPLRENGRDDHDKLGFLIVHVDAEGHRVEVVRCGDDAEGSDHPSLAPGRGPAPTCAAGVELRHDWALPREIPYGNLDEFCRKRARNDYPLMALWDMGVVELRVPAEDLLDTPLLDRMHDLASHGARFTVFSAGLPRADIAAAVAEHAAILTGWEVVVPRSRLPEAAERLEELGVTGGVFLSAVGSPRATDGAYFSHFPSHGFEPGEPTVDEHASAPWVSGIVYRIDGDQPWAGIQAAAAHAARIGRDTCCRLILPRGGECEPGTDDHAAAAFVLEALVALTDTGARGWFDTLVDHDRGYYPRHGLLDRRCAPRLSGDVLRTVSRLLAGHTTIHDVSTPTRRAWFVQGLGTFVAHDEEPPTGPILDLQHGATLPAPRPGVPYLRPE